MINKKQSSFSLNINRMLDIFIFSLIASIFFLVPILFTSFTAQGMGMDKMFLFFVLTLIGLISWFTKGILVGELSFKKNNLNWSIFLSLVVLLISSFLSISQKDSFVGVYGNVTMGFFSIVVFAMFFFLVVNNIDTEKMKIIFWLFLSSVSLVTIYSFLQILGVYVFPWRFTHFTYFNPLESVSSLAMFLSSILPLFVVMTSQVGRVYDKMKNSKILAIRIVLSLVVLVLLLTMYLIEGFSYWPITIFGVAIVLVFFLVKSTETSRASLLAPVVIFFLLVIISVSGNIRLVKVDLPTEVGLSTGTSFNIARESLKENPFFGSGLSTFYYDFNKFKSIDFNNSPLWNIQFNAASGVFLELAATTGVAGLIASIVFVVLFLFSLTRTAIKSKRDEIRPIVIGLTSSVMVIVLFAIFFSFNSSFLLFAVLMTSLAASSIFSARNEDIELSKFSFKSSSKYATVSAIVFIVVSSGIIISLVYGTKTYIADIYIKKTALSQMIGERITNTNTAISLAPFQDGYYLVQSRNYLELANNQNAIDGLSVAIASAKTAVELSPKNIVNLKNIARIYENASLYVGGATEWAEMFYKNILDISPNDPEAYLKIGIINMGRANAEKEEDKKDSYMQEAIKNYNEALDKKSNYSLAHYAKAVALEILDNNDLAIDELGKAVMADNTNVDYQFELGRLYFNRGISSPNLSQTSVDDIVSGEEEKNDLSVEQEIVRPQITKTTRNDDINIAEQLFFSILSLSPNHANAKYALALMYQKLGERDRAKAMVGSLLDTLQDEKSIKQVKDQFLGLY